MDQISLEIANLTPHDLNMIEEDGTITYPRLEVEPGRFLTVRAAQTTEDMFIIPVEDIKHQVSKSTFGKPYFCTVNEEGKDEQPYLGEVPEADYYVVSILSLQAIVDNGGCEQFQPDEFLAVGQTIRDNKGKVIGSTGFSIL